MIEDNPLRCVEDIRRSNDDKFIIDNGTWKVHPLLAPPFTIIARRIKYKDTTNSRIDNAFSLGNIISDENSINGINILPSPPIKIIN